MSVNIIEDKIIFIGNGILTSTHVNNNLSTYTKVEIKDYTSIGDNAFYGKQITSIIISNSVTSIASNSLRSTLLESVTIPNSVTTIDGSAFQDCSALTSVTISDSLKSIGQQSFRNCTKLSLLIIPNSVTSIGDNAFNNCSSLPSVTIPNLVTRIAISVFYGCIKLKSIIIPTSVTSISSSALSSTGLTSVIIPNSVTNIDTQAFRTCTNLTTVTMSNSVNYITDELFRDCTSLQSFTTPDSVTSIGSSAFYGCVSLTSVTIPPLVTSLATQLFRDCVKLRSVTIPNLVTRIDASTFQDCSSLTSVIIPIPNSVTSIGQQAFRNTRINSIIIPSLVTSIGTNAFYGSTSLTSVTIPNLVTHIGAGAFEQCTALTSAIIGTSVTSIGINAFQGCSLLTTITIKNNQIQDIPSPSTNVDFFGKIGVNTVLLTSVIIPNSVTRIEDYEFYLSSDLTSVTIPDSVTHIGASAFKECTALTSVIIPYSVTSIGTSAFLNSGLTHVNIFNNRVAGILSPSSSVSFFGANVTTVIPEKTLVGTGILTKDIVQTELQYIGKAIIVGFSSISDDAFANQTQPTISSLTISDSVTSIGLNSFSLFPTLREIIIDSNNSNYSSINGALLSKNNILLIRVPEGMIGSYIIPKSVTLIGTKSFENCIGIASVTMHSLVTNISSYAFSFCTSLTSVTIPNLVTHIGAGAFEQCTALTSAIIGTSVTSIGINAFQGCSLLTTITIKNNQIQDIPSPSTNVDFFGKNGVNTVLLTSVIIPDSVTHIEDYEFYLSSNLTSVTIPDSVTSIGINAFQGCASLTSLPLGNNLKNIREGALSGCINLTSITIPNSVTSIGHNILNNCDQLKLVIIGNSVTSINHSSFRSCENLTSVTIGNSVTNIDYDAFLECRALKTIIIPDTVTNIALNSFKSCSGLTLIVLGNSVSNIGESAFDNCVQLETLIIPLSVTSIGTNAFQGCTLLTTITIKNNQIQDIPSPSTNVAFFGKNGVNTVLRTPVIIFSSITKTYGTSSFPIVYNSSSNGQVDYISLNPNIATVDNSTKTITIVGAGDTLIIATQTQTDIFYGTTNQITLNVNKATPIMTDFIIPQKSIGSPSFSIYPPQSNSNGSFMYTSSNHNVATISGSIMTIKGIGHTTISAIQSSTNNFNLGHVTTIFIVIPNLFYVSSLNQTNSLSTLAIVSGSIEYPPILNGTTSYGTININNIKNAFKFYVPANIETDLSTWIPLNKGITSFNQGSIIINKEEILRNLTLAIFGNDNTILSISNKTQINTSIDTAIASCLNSVNNSNSISAVKSVGDAMLYTYQQRFQLSYNAIVDKTYKSGEKSIYRNCIATGLGSNAVAILKVTVVGGVITEIIFKSNQTGTFLLGEELNVSDPYGKTYLNYKHTLINQADVNILNGTIENEMISLNGIKEFLPNTYQLGVYTDVHVLQSGDGAGTGAICTVMFDYLHEISNIIITNVATTPYTTGLPVILAHGGGNDVNIVINPINDYQKAVLNNTLGSVSGTPFPFEIGDGIRVMYTILNHPSQQVAGSSKIATMTYQFYTDYIVV